MAIMIAQARFAVDGPQGVAPAPGDRLKADRLEAANRLIANFGGTLAPNFRTPRVVQMSAGIQHQLGEHSMFSIDYVRQIGTQYPLGIDTNHVGDASHLNSAAALAATSSTSRSCATTRSSS